MGSSSVRTWIVPFFIILLAAHVAAVPPLPAEFYGSILIDGQPAPAGTIITAQIQGVDRGSIITEVAGFYGGPGLFDSRLKVNVSEDEVGPGEITIIFSINGQQAAQNVLFEAGSSRQLDLSTGGGVKPSSGNVSNQNLSASLQTGSASPDTLNSTIPNQYGQSTVRNTSDTADSLSNSLSYGLDQPRVFSSDDGLAELSFQKDTMLFSPDGQFLNAVGLRSRNIADLPPVSPNPSVTFSGYAYEVIPLGTYFNPKGVLTLKLPPEQAYKMINARPVIYEFLSQTASWEPVNTNANVFTNTITADIFEASIYGLFIPAAVGTDNVSLANVTNISPRGPGANVTNISPVPAVLIPAVMPVITPQAVITPGAMMTPSATAPLTPGKPGSDEPVGQADTPAQPTQEPVNESPEKNTFNGPLLAIIGLLVLLIGGNVMVFVVYRYWWCKRVRNG